MCSGVLKPRSLQDPTKLLLQRLLSVNAFSKKQSRRFNGEFGGWLPVRVQVQQLETHMVVVVVLKVSAGGLQGGLLGQQLPCRALECPGRWCRILLDLQLPADGRGGEQAASQHRTHPSDSSDAVAGIRRCSSRRSEAAIAILRAKLGCCLDGRRAVSTLFMPEGPEPCPVRTCFTQRFTLRFNRPSHICHMQCSSAPQEAKLPKLCNVYQKPFLGRETHEWLLTIKVWCVQRPHETGPMWSCPIVAQRHVCISPILRGKLIKSSSVINQSTFCAISMWKLFYRPIARARTVPGYTWRSPMFSAILVWIGPVEVRCQVRRHVLIFGTGNVKLVASRRVTPMQTTWSLSTLNSSVG